MKKSIFKKAIAALVMVTTLFSMLVLPFSHTATPITASAATTYTENVNDYDKTLVIDDLGEEYVAQFANASGGNPQLQSFMEYCYSPKTSVLNSMYGLYIYIYNPSRIEFSTSGNVANMATAYNAYGAPSAYSNLRLMNCGHTTGKYDKLFYKFRVLGLQNVLANAQACEAKSGYRRYDLVGIQLRKEGSTNATDYEIARTFTYSGYAEGCGAEGESTLVCKQSEMEVLNLEVHPTVYRPEGNNGTNEFTKDSLHSVWFAVPNEYINKYGEMYAVHATWLNAVLKPALVTGNKEAHDAIAELLGQEIGDHTDQLEYVYLGGVHNENLTGYIKECEVSYNAAETMSFHWALDWGFGECISNNRLQALYMLFDSGAAKDSADGYYVSPSEILAQMEASKSYGGELVNGKYSKKIFSEVDKEWQDVTISADNNMMSNTHIGGLTSQVVDKNWFEKMYGFKGDIVSTETFTEVKGVQKVEASDVSGTAEEAVKKLFINENDFEALKADVTEAQANDKTVYLFRYMISEFCSYEAELWSNSSGIDYDKVDSNAYFFTETVDLDFEIIDVTFKRDEIKTVIPVVMSPIDIVHASEPPIHTESDKTVLDNLKDWWNEKQAEKDGFVNTLKKTIAAIVVVVVGSVVVVVIVKAVSKKKGQSVRIDVGTSSKKSKPKRKKRRK